MKKRMYGYQRDFKDPRDLVFKAAVKMKDRPRIVDLSDIQSPVQDQGNLGSCVGHGTVGALECLIIKNAMKQMIQRKVQDERHYDLSPLMLYLEARRLDGMVKEDSGAQIRNAIKALAKVGVCLESLWPYDIKKFDKQPPPEAYKDAKTRIIKSYRRINGLTDMLNCLAEGYPFTYGFTVYESFESSYTGKTGIVKLPTRNEGVVGGHCVEATGYNEDEKVFYFKNSYGTGWGQKGYGKKSFDYMRDYSSDAWQITV